MGSGLFPYSPAAQMVPWVHESRNDSDNDNDSGSISLPTTVHMMQQFVVQRLHKHAHGCA